MIGSITRRLSIERRRLTRPWGSRRFPPVGKKIKPSQPIGARQAAWRELVILCRKCGGKLKGGFGDDGRDDLRTALRDALRQAGRRRDVRIIEAGCFGVCPKRAVVALRGSLPGQLLIVPQGQPAAAVLDGLGIIPGIPAHHPALPTA